LSGTYEHAEAQFWKKWFGKKEQQHKRKPVQHKKVEPVTKTKPPEKKRREIEYPASRLKSRYRVDVLAALYLDDLVKNDKPVYKDKIPEKALQGMDFYQGIQLAADTLNEKGYDIDVYVHDITDPSQTPEALIKNKTLDSSDLIIGALQSHEIPSVAAFAKKHEINFVSALSPSDGGIKENPYFILMQPTLQAHCEWITKHITQKYRNQNVTLYYRTSASLDDLVYHYLNSDDSSVQYKKILCNNAPDKKQLEKLFDSTRTNVIVMSIMDIGYAEALLKQLYELFPAYHFEVYGMPSWRTMPSLRKPDAYPNVAIDITAPFYFDLSMPADQELDRNYKKEFGGNASELVYRAYETMVWYSYLLRRYGTIFDNKFNDNKEAPFTKFEIKPKRDKEDNLLYNENRHICLFKYQSSSYMVEQ